jgi:PKD repeat protein
MKNKILFCLFIFLTSQKFSFAQISGDSIVCAGYTYNYSVNIPGAVSYNWTLPSGWYNLTGQGTSSISATCNVSEGNICAEGFDINSNSLGIQCITTEWGNGGASGWDLFPSSFYYCSGQPRDVHWMILPNGSGSTGCPNGCGSGTQVQNIIYGLYDSSFPYPQFIAEIDGSWIQMPPVIATYQAFYVDISAGNNFPDAVEISGGCGAASNNNTSSSNEVFPALPTFTQFPDPACIGDTVVITQTQMNITNVSWSINFGAVFISQPDTEQYVVVANSLGASIYYYGFDEMYFCNTGGGYTLNMCTTPAASFSAVSDSLCPGTCTDFINGSINALTNEWIFPGSTTSTSSDANPSSICYNTPGSYDVTLIITNAQGSDTLVLPGYITVFPTPQSQNIIQSGDTLISLQGYLTYQWYLNGNTIAGATNYFYVAIQNGNYSVVASDSNLCEVEAVLTNVIASVNSSSSELFSLAPNPVKDALVISFPYTAGSMKFEIFNLPGESIFKTSSIENSGKYFIDVQFLPAGIYILEGNTEKGETSSGRARFIKE